MKKHLLFCFILVSFLFHSVKVNSQTNDFPGIALNFDGMDDYVNLGNDTSLDLGNTLTIEVWVKPSELSTRQSVFSTRSDNAAGSFQLEIGPCQGGTNRVSITGISTWVAQTEDNAITLNKWNHIVYTRSGTGAGTHKIYVNGVEKTLISDADYTFIDNTSNKVLASGSNGGQLFNGILDEVRIWSVVRTESEIRENMYETLSGTESGLISYWQFNEGSGTSLTDAINSNDGTLYNMDESDWVTSTISYPRIKLSKDFDKFELASKSFNSIDVGNYSSPEIYDIDNDGLLDLLIGESYGNINHYEQDSINSYTFHFLTDLINNIKGNFKTPEICDLDNDGLLDMLVGNGDGYIRHYEQISANSYDFSLIEEKFNSIELSNWSVPIICDIDNDGLLDLLVGEKYGHLYHYEQDSVNSYSFSLVTTNFNSIDVGLHSAPTISDINDDGLLDLIIGEYNGHLNYYEQDSINSYTFNLISSNYHSIDVGTESEPMLCDINDDGFFDLLIGGLEGKISHYEQMEVKEINFGDILLPDSRITPYFIKGLNIVSEMNLSCSSAFQISKYRDSLYSQSLTLQADNGSIWDTVFVKFTPTEEIDYVGSLVHTSTSAESKSISLLGSGISGLDHFAGTAIDFNGKNNYVNIGSDATLNVGNTLTIEAWVKPHDLSTRQRIYSTRSADAGGSFQLEIGPCDGGTKRVAVSGPGIWVASTGNNVIKNDEWVHVVYTRSDTTAGSQKIYINGKEQALATDSDYKFIDNSSDKTLVSNTFGQAALNGTLEEVRLWNVVRSESEIRENMNIPLTGTESGLVSYWQCNDESGNVLSDPISGNAGHIYNMEDADWIVSSTPFGEGVVNTQIVNTTGNVIFTNTDIAMDFTEKTGIDTILVCKIDTLPNILPQNANEFFGDHYWVLNNYGSGSFNADLSFTLSEDFVLVNEAVPESINLYTRASQADTNWAFLTTAISADAVQNSVTFSGITSFGQYLISKTVKMDKYAGTTLDFKGGDDYAICNSVSSTFPSTEINVSFWMKSSDTINSGTPLSYASTADDNDLLFYNYNNLNIYMAGHSSGSTGISLTDGEWHHLSVNWRSSDGLLDVYKDGEKVYTKILSQGETITAGGSLVFAQEQDNIGGGFQTDQAFTGKLEEVRIWNKCLTEQELRENMYLNLSKNELGLISYWQFNEGNGTSLSDAKNSNIHTLYNMEDSDWEESSIPFGSGFSNTHIISTTGTYSFGDCDLTMNVVAKTGVDTLVVSKIEHCPNNNQDIFGTSLDAQYWEINAFGGGTFTADLSFTVSEQILLQASNYKLFKRDKNADGSWSFVATANTVDASNKVINFPSISEEGQYIIYTQVSQITILKAFDQFDFQSEHFSAIDVGDYSKVEIHDIDMDGLLDLIIGEKDGNLNHYEQASKDSYTFNLLTEDFNSINVGEYAATAICDMDNDGLLDLLIGEKDGNLNHYEQDSTYSYTFSLITENFNAINVGEYATPEIYDIDNDGLLDLLIGEKNGNINHYEQVLEHSYDFNLINESFNSIDVGVYAVPAISDIDNDGLLDLLIGEKDDNLNHYEQDSENSNTFTLITEDFDLIYEGEYIAPEIYDIDNDGLLDFLVGERLGNIGHCEQSEIVEMDFAEVFPGESKTLPYSVKGIDISSDINLSCSSPFQISKYQDSLYSQTLSLPTNNGKIGDTVFVKFTPLEKTDYCDTIIHISSDVTSKNLSLLGTWKSHLDGFPGSSLEFDGIDDYVNIGNDTSLALGNMLTIEAWVKPGNLSSRQGVFSTRLNNAAGSFQLEIGPGSGGTNRVAVTGYNTWIAQTPDNAIDTNQWFHLAYTRTGTGVGNQKIYINGTEQSLITDSDYEFLSNSSDKILAAGTNGGSLFNGELDEVRIWNVARTEAEIRENMYLTLSGLENNLVSNWQFNKESGTVLLDTINSNNGILYNMDSTDWVSSSIPFGRGASNTQIISAIGNYSFSTCGLTMEITAKTGIDTLVVSKIENAPNVYPEGIGTSLSRQYWEINSFGQGSFTANISFVVNERISFDAQHFQLYRRAKNSNLDWTLVGTANAVDNTNHKISFDTISEEGQYIIMEQNPQIAIFKDFYQYELLDDVYFHTGSFTYPAIEIYDLDNDGLLDFLVGATNAGGIKHYEQDSLNSFSTHIVSKSFNSINDVTPAPEICDIDNDGLLDLLIGEYGGKISLYEQTSLDSYDFELVTMDFNSINVVEESSPCIVDLDQDGLLDLLVGKSDGKLAYYKQLRKNSYDFELVTNFFDSIDVGSYSSPEICDLDNDGLLDLLVGEESHNALLFEQTSKNSTSFTLVNENFYYNGMIYTVMPEIADLDHDGLYDLFIADEVGYVRHYEETGIEGIDFKTLLLGKSKIIPYHMKGIELSSNIDLSCSSDFQISQYMDSLYSQSLTIEAIDGRVTDSIFIKFTPTEETAYVESVLHISDGAESLSLPISGIGKEGFDGFPGTALDFDGSNDYINIGNDNSLDLENTLTIEAWIKPDKLSSRQDIFSNRSTNAAGSFQLEIGPGDGGVNRVALSGNGTWIASTGDSVISKNSWNHIVYTRSAMGVGNQKIYVNGVEQTLIADADYEFLNNSSDKTLGKSFNGTLDEVRIWNIVRTEAEIRENMYLSLPDTVEGLVSNWQFNDGSGDDLIETFTGNTGTLIKMDSTAWVNSSIPFGSGFSNTQIISTTGNVDFGVGGLTMDITEKTGTDTIVISKIELAPNINPLADATPLMQYWEIDAFGEGTFTADISFVINEEISLQKQYRLYRRNNNAHGDWEFAGSVSTVNVLNHTLTFDSISQGGQYLVCSQTPRISLITDYNHFELVNNNFGFDPYSDPETCDLDNDGLLDIFSAQGAYIQHFEQDIENSLDFHYVSENVLPKGDEFGVSCNFCDIDNDGLYDLLSTTDGRMIHFEQASENSYEMVRKSYFFDSIPAHREQSPTTIDVDNDGLLDFFVGGGDGKITQYEQASEDSYHFNVVTTNFQSINTGYGRVTTEFCNLNNNGLIDLLVGNHDGHFWYYEQGMENPNYFNLITTHFAGLSMGQFGSKKITSCDMDHDGLVELFTSGNGGRMYERSGYEEINFDTVFLGESLIIPYAVKGINLISDLTLSCSSDFQVSIFEDSLYSQSINLLADTDEVIDSIFVKFTPSQVGYYSDSVVHSSLGAASKILPLSGIVMNRFDNFPGSALAFDGENDYVSGTGIDTSLNAITIEAWVYQNSFSEEIQRYVTISPEVAVLRFDGSQYGGYHSVHFYIKKSSGSLYSIRVDSVLMTNEWMHIAATYDGDTMKLYLNGELLDTKVPNGGLFPPNGDFAFSSTGSPFDGKMEEVRLWSVARTQEEIRENMYLPLTAAPITGLVSYWQFNDSSGTELVDKVEGNTGTLNNMDDFDWVDSSIPFGNGFVDSQTESSGTITFVKTGLTMDFAAQSGAEITATRIDTIANLNPTEADTVFQNQYWVVNRYGTGAFDTDLTFEVSEDLTVEDESEPSQIKLYTRGSTADTTWVLLTSASSVNAANNTATFEGLTAFSQFIIAREINHGIELDLTTFLEGPYNGTEMNPSTGSGLPLLQPYNTAPWNYAGTESVDTIPADVVDWVMIELRDTTDAALATGETMLARRAAFILKDGKIVGLDGDSYKTCPVSTTNTVVNNLFVVIYHRNHLPIMSSNPLIKTNGIYTYDFSTAIGQVYGNSQADLGSGVYGMFAADMNADGVIDQADILLWEQVAGQSGYLMKDANLDSQVDNKDKNDLLVPNQNQSSQLPE